MSAPRSAIVRPDDARRRRLVFRSWHRGTREMDLIMGRFAEANVARMGEEEIAVFERLLEVHDAELFAWIAGTAPIPADYDTPVLAALCAFHRDFPTAYDMERQ